MEKAKEKDILRILEKYGNVDQVRISEDEQQEIYVLYYNLRNMEVFQESKETIELPIIVRFDNKETMSLHTYYTKEQFESENGDELTQIVNYVNENIERAKYYVDGTGDICCEALINTCICDENELKNALEDLLTGFLFIIMNDIGCDHEG